MAQFNLQAGGADDGPRGDRDVMDRQHATYAIVRFLDALQLANWTHTLLLWLGAYDGFETHIPPEDDPTLAVRDILNGYLLQQQPVRIGQIAADVCGLDFLHHRAAWVNDAAGTQRNWMPLDTPWLEFVTQGERGEDLRVWWSEQPWPPADLLRQHLLAGYVRLNGLR